MKRKIGEIYNISIIIGDKNLKNKNEIHIDELSNVPTSGGGGGKSNYKYYDCLMDVAQDVSHDGFLADISKRVDEETHTYEIAPEAVGTRMLAVGFDMSKRVYIHGEWVDVKTFLEEREGFDFSAHPEITEEEFYHIPDDVVWDCNTEEGCKEAFESLWKLCERYEGEFDNGNPLPLYVWYKSIDLVKFGTIATGVYNFRADGYASYIFLDQYNELVLTRRGDVYSLVLE